MTSFLETMMRDWIIEKLGGYTESEMQQARNCLSFDGATLKDCQETIKRLQALIPVSAVLPKKRKNAKT